MEYDTIWKFEIKPNVDLDIPKGGEVLSAGAIGDDIFIWVRVDPKAETEKRRYIAYGTGHKLPKNRCMEFVGTVATDDGRISHVFYLP